MLNFLTSATSLIQESMGQALSEVRKNADSVPLAQDSERATGALAEAIGNE